MKKPMKRFLLFMTSIAMFGMMSSCKEEGPHKDDIVKFTAVINSQPTVPKATSSAQGTGVFEYNKSTMELTYNITYKDLVPKAVTINHADPAWERGDIIHEATTPSATQATGKVKLNVEEQTWLIGEQLYVNVATEANIYGEIRGQILADDID